MMNLSQNKRKNGMFPYHRRKGHVMLTCLSAMTVVLLITSVILLSVSVDKKRNSYILSQSVAHLSIEQVAQAFVSGRIDTEAHLYPSAENPLFYYDCDMELSGVTVFYLYSCKNGGRGTPILTVTTDKPDAGARVVYSWNYASGYLNSSESEP